MQKSILIRDINNITTILLRSNCSSNWDSYDFTVHWEGLVFINGIKSGEESIKVFVKELQRVGIEDACQLLKGIFFILVEKKTDGVAYAFVDNSGLYQAFYKDANISTSFLELVKLEKYFVSDFDPEAVVEFLYFGNLFSNRTLFSTINRIPGDKIFRFTHREGEMRILQKKILSLSINSGNGTKSFHEIFKDLAISLSNRKVSIDLTGGIDSRLIAVLLDYFGLEFETATSGGATEYGDVSTSKEVANILGHPWYSTIHSVSSLEKDILELFYASEGLHNILVYHRMFQLQKARLERGIDTVISGVGGELFKDAWWLQDFPFYYKRSANIERLVNMRIMSFKPLHSILTKPYSQISYSLRSKIIQDVSQYSLQTNTKTYDNIFLNFRMKDIAGRELTNHSFFLKAYAPLLDFDVARIGFNLPRRLRIFNTFHRKELTKINPLIASIATSEGGISASSGIISMVNDLPKYIKNRFGRLLLKLKKRNKSFTNLNDPNFFRHVKEMKIIKESLEMFKDLGVIKKNMEIEQIDEHCIGSFLSLYMLVNYMNDKSELGKIKGDK